MDAGVERMSGCDRNRRDGELSMLNGVSLGDIAAQAARKYADRACLVYGARRWTFGELEKLVARLASALAKRLPAQARVGVFMTNRPEYAFLQFALERAGIVRVPMNARFTSHEAGVILEDCGAQALFFDSFTADPATEIASRLPGLWCCQIDGTESINGPSWQMLLAGDVDSESRTVSADDICTINYTSGTSGKPKGVVLTHRNWCGVYRNMLIDRDIRREDVVAHIGPLTHASGTYFMPWYLRGACNLIVEGATVDALLEAIPRERITTFTCVPTVLTRIVNHRNIDQLDLSSLRAIGYGAEPIPLNTFEKALKRFGPMLTQNYGLTEAMMTVTLLRPEEHFTIDQTSGERRLRVGCIGRPYTFVDVELRAPDGRIVGDGEIGEITIRSEHMMGTYWNRPEETAKTLRDGWLWSGDLAMRDAEGFITLAGRSKEMLISGGFNIYPAEIEACLTSHPAVMEAAVIGLADPDWGEIAVAYVSIVPNARTDASQLQAHCKGLIGIKTPKAFHVLDSLPKNANGKIDKAALRQLAAEKNGVTHG